MASIELNSVCIDFPIYNATSRSLKTRLVQATIGGQLSADPRGHVFVRALENLNLSIKDGDRVGIIGHNGSGKSSLLRLLSGVYEPSSGAARIQGKVGSLIDISLGIDPEATGKENIFIRGGLLGLSKATVKKQLDDIVEFSELGDFVDMPVRTYSSGMHLRLVFAVSTILRPEILLMDEWLSVGDEGFKHKAEKRLTAVVQATNILVIATHSREIIMNTCNRVIWLEHGKIRMDGDPNSVATAYFDGT